VARSNPFATFFAPGPDRPPRDLAPADLRRVYEGKRWSVFLSVTFGYAIFYVCRINFSVAKMSLLQDGILDTTQMGLIGSAMLVAYAIGKLVNGFISDRVNVRRFIASALLASAIANLLFGLNTIFVVFVVLWALNGWFQSGGSAPSVVALSNWFTFRERGTRYGIWSMSHPAGEAFTFAVTGALVSWLGWRWGFWGPGLLAGAAALILFRTLADRPETQGLPPVWQYKGEVEPIRTEKAPIGKLQLEVLRNPGVWILGLASATMHVGRYGMDHWGPMFLQTAKGYSQAESGLFMAISPIASLAGTGLSGLISDRLFASNRTIPLLMYGLLDIAALFALFLIPPGHGWLDTAALIVFGFAIGGLVVFLGGLMAVDIVSRRAAGAAMGLVGVFSYLGAAAQDTLSGYLLNGSQTVVDGKPFLPPESFDAVFPVWIGASIVSLLLACSLWWIRPPAAEPSADATPPAS